MAYGSLMSTHDLGGAFDTAVIHVTSSVHTITNVYAKKDGIVYTGISTGTNAFDIKVNDKGTYEIWASVDGAGASKVDSVAVSQPEEYNVDVLIVSRTLNDNSWVTISKISSSGTATSYWAIGDSKEIILNGTVKALTLNNLSIRAVIIGIDHNKDVESPDTHLIHFQIGKINASNREMNGLVDDYYNTNVYNTKNGFYMAYSFKNYGWSASACRDYLGQYKTDNNTFLKCLPQELQTQLKVVIKYSTEGHYGTPSSYKPAESKNLIFLLSEFEWVGSEIYGNDSSSDKNVYYDYYKIGNDYRVKNYKNENTVKCWTRSQGRSGSSGVVINDYNERTNLANTQFSYAISPCFCV